jgi:hypothetical protein
MKELFSACITVSVLLLVARCESGDRHDQSVASLNRQIVRLTQENVDLQKRLQEAEKGQDAIRTELQLLREKIAYVSSGTTPVTTAGISPAAPSLPTSPVPAKSGGFTDWGKSTAGAASLTSASTPTRSASSPTMDATIIAQCSGKWGTNYEMVEYCQKEQQGAKDRLDRGNVYGISGPVFGSIRQECQQKWQNNFEMREYCEKEQAGAYKRISR